MLTASQQKLEKIRRTSAILRTICKVGFVLMAVLTLVTCVALAVGGDVTLKFFEVQISVADLTLASRLVLVGLFLVSMGVVFKALLQLQRLFSSYADGKIFTRQAAATIRQFGITVIIWAVVCTAWDLVPRLFSQAPLPVLVHLRVDFVVVGLVIIAISWFMEAAAELQEESNLTI